MNLRERLHRWSVLFYVCLAMTLAAWRYVRRARHRRRLLRHIESWPW